MGLSTIVVVESDPSVRHLFDEVLQDEGYRVQLLEPPALCSGRLAAAAPDLVLVEITPLTSGAVLACVGQLRRRPEMAQTPVVVSTTDYRLIGRRAADLRRLGCGVLLKPFALDTFLEVVSMSLARAGAHRAICAA